MQAGWVSADLYYNLGTSYLQTKSIGPAILNLERALVRASGDADILYNLQLARESLRDDISEVPEFFPVALVAPDGPVGHFQYLEHPGFDFVVGGDRGADLMDPGERPACAKTGIPGRSAPGTAGFDPSFLVFQS